mmetsp:Transcript_4388/g.5062  ORF Transcript_4388/g.5062 Transcript_4388/m.5062 type:complete len:138 (-) Transcript_4388:948-1361(-)
MPKKKVTVEVFCDTMYNKVSSLIDPGGSIFQKTFRDLEVDPQQTLMKQMPKDLSDEKKQSDNAVKRNDLLMKKFVEKEIRLSDNRTVLCSIILVGQCTKALITQLKTNKEFNAKVESGDFVWLLKTITAVSSLFFLI